MSGVLDSTGGWTMTSFDAAPRRATPNQAAPEAERPVAGHGTEAAGWVGAVAGLSVPAADTPWLRRSGRPTPAPDGMTLRRTKILGATGLVHINDYHFIDRLTLGNAPSSGTHDVLVIPFDDFDGLAAQARLSPKKPFGFGGVQWGSRHLHRAVPDRRRQGLHHAQHVTARGPHHPRQSWRRRAGRLHQPLGQGPAAEEGPRRCPLPPAAAACSPPAGGPAHRDDREHAARHGRGDVRPGELLGHRAEKGTSDDGTAEAFLWGPTGARRKSHLHLFLTCGPKKKGVDDYDHPITIVGYHMTTSHSVHLVLRDGDVVGTSPKDRAPGPGSSDAAEVTEMTLVCDLLNRARTDEEEEISTTPATPAAEVKPWQVKAAAARELDVHVETLAKMLGVRVPVMQYFLSTIAGLEPEDVEALASGALPPPHRGVRTGREPAAGAGPDGDGGRDLHGRRHRAARPGRLPVGAGGDRALLQGSDRDDRDLTRRRHGNSASP